MCESHTYFKMVNLVLTREIDSLIILLEPISRVSEKLVEIFSNMPQFWDKRWEEKIEVPLFCAHSLLCIFGHHWRFDLIPSARNLLFVSWKNKVKILCHMGYSLTEVSVGEWGSNSRKWRSFPISISTHGKMTQTIKRKRNIQEWKHHNLTWFDWPIPAYCMRGKKFKPKGHFSVWHIVNPDSEQYFLSSFGA